MKQYIVYDCETQILSDDVPGGWNNIYGMGMSSAVTYCFTSGMYKFWDHNQRDDLCEYLNGKIAISYNGIQFDSQLLLGNDRIIESNGVTKNNKWSWFNADIFVEIWKHVLNNKYKEYPELIKQLKIHGKKMGRGVMTLGAISRHTLGLSKSGDGAMAPKLFQDGKIVELFEYNLQDVRVTKQLYEFIKKYKYVVSGSYDIVKF